MNPTQGNWRRALMAIGALMLLLAWGCGQRSEPVGGREGDPPAPWAVHIWRVDEALERKNVSLAVRAWHDAYVEALGSRRSEGLIEVGDASLRIGEVTRQRKEYEPDARRCYLAALIRARAQASPDGVLRACEAFAALGDREVAKQCFRIADHLAALRHEPEASERVRAFAERMAVFSAAVP